MGNTYNESRKLHKNLKPHQLDNEMLSFSAQHAVYAKKKRRERSDTEVGSGNGHHKMRAAQDIRARRAKRHALTTDVHMEPSKASTSSKLRASRYSG